MSLEQLPVCSSPSPSGVMTGTTLCDGGVATASDEVQPEWIHATAALSGGHQISVQRLKDETSTALIRQELPESYHYVSDAAKLKTEMLAVSSQLYNVDNVDRVDTDATIAMLTSLSKITPACQIRLEIARQLNVPSEAVVLIKGAREVDDSNPDESGPFHYVVKTPNEVHSWEFMPMSGERIKKRLRKSRQMINRHLFTVSSVAYEDVIHLVKAEGVTDQAAAEKRAQSIWDMNCFTLDIYCASDGEERTQAEFICKWLQAGYSWAASVAHLQTLTITAQKRDLSPTFKEAARKRLREKIVSTYDSEVRTDAEVRGDPS